MNKIYKIAYFGGDPLGAPVLERLVKTPFQPSLVVCNPDRPSGRGQKLAPPATKVVAQSHGLEVAQPETLGASFFQQSEWDLFIVVAYNKILPEWLIELPKHKTINLHPSLLPKYRGANPIRTAILEDDKELGVSIMLLDEKMDHGPILTQAKAEIENWPIKGGQLDQILTDLGADLLLQTLPQWLTSNLKPQEQNHPDASYTKKVSKQDGELKLDPYNMPVGENAKQMYLKILAYDGWPGTFFFHDGRRYKVLEAHLDETGKLHIDSIVPEGKTDTPFLSHFK
ncbi:hypothetical protein CL653_02635 [bacterium]|nr:hypothetical protein [bacterium]